MSKKIGKKNESKLAFKQGIAVCVVQKERMVAFLESFKQ